MRILCISTQLPPYNGSANIRAMNYINYLQRKGNQVDVITVDYPINSIAFDISLVDAIDSGVNVYRISPGLPYKLFYRKKFLHTSKNSSHVIKSDGSSKLKEAMRQLIKTNLLMPDSFAAWVIPAIKKGVKLIKSETYDCIFSMHETPSSHLVGYQLKKMFPNIKWVGYWSDPWNGDPERKKSLKSNLEEFLESKVVHLVDKLLFTTEQCRNFYLQKYNLLPCKTDIVFRGYDLKHYLAIKAQYCAPHSFKADKINIIHTGTIYHALRDVGPLCSALSYIKQERPQIYKKLNFIFVGDFDNDFDRERLIQFDIVTAMNTVPFHEAEKYMVFADCLLLYGNKHGLQVPGKLYEYVGSSSIILTLMGDKADELKCIMTDVRKGPVILNESANIVKGLVTIYNLYISGRLRNTIWSKPVLKFEWNLVVSDLEAKILSVLG